MTEKRKDWTNAGTKSIANVDVSGPGIRSATRQGARSCL